MGLPPGALSASRPVGGAPRSSGRPDLAELELLTGAGAELQPARAAAGRAVTLAGVVGYKGAVAAFVIAHGHPLAALAAYDQPLQQGGAFPGGSGLSVVTVCGGVGGQGGLVGLELGEGDVSGVGVGEQDGPFLAWFGDGAHRAVGCGEVAFAPVAVGARVSGVVQGVEHVVVAQRFPVELAGSGAGEVSRGEGQALRGEGLDDRAGRSGPGEHVEQVRDRVADAGVGVEHDFARRVVDQPDGQPHRQLPAAGLGQQPALHPGVQEVQFGLAHRAFEAQQQPVVEIARVIQPVFVADQGVVQGADLQQLMPVGVVSGQARAFQPEHDPGFAEGDVGDQPLEAFPVGGAGAGVALVDVDDDDVVGGPAQRGGLAAQVVLAAGRFGVVDDLIQR